MKIIKNIFILVFIYVITFILLREVIETNQGWIQKGVFIPHDKYNHTGNPNSYTETSNKMPEKYLLKVKINSQGLREDKDIKIPKPDGIYRILVVGDSFIFGTNIKLSNILERILNKAYNLKKIKFEVVNCGTPSYSPMLHLARLKHQFLSLDPDAIIYLPDLTDVFDDTHRYKFFARFDKKGKLIKVIGSNRILRAKRRHQKFFNSILQRTGLISNKTRDISTNDVGGPSPHIYDHIREKEGSPSAFTIEEINFSLKFIERYVHISRPKGIHISFAVYPHLAQIIPENHVYPNSTISTIDNRLFEQGIRKLTNKLNVPFKSFFKAIKSEVLSGTVAKISVSKDFRFIISSENLAIGFKVKEDIIDPKSGEVILKAGKKIQSTQAIKLEQIAYHSKVEIDPESLLGHILVDEIFTPMSAEPKFNYDQRVTKGTLEIIKEKNLQEIKILKIKKLYFYENIHFNDQGLKFLGESIGNWVINNPSETIGFDPSAY